MEQTISIILSVLTFVTLLLAFRDRIFKSGKYEKSLEDKVSELEKSDGEFKVKITDINKDIKTIKENHLYHIEKDINELKLQQERDIGSIKINLAEINTTLKIKLNNKNE